MKDSKLRKIILENNARITKFRLSAHRADLVGYIRNGGPTGSSDISKMFDIPLQSVSTTLKTLCDLGYLKRREVDSETGGREYLYWAARGLK